MEDKNSVLFEKIGRMLMDLEFLMTERQKLLQEIKELREKIAEQEAPASA
jgi:regulator of replication initiation timing